MKIQQMKAEDRGVVFCATYKDIAKNPNEASAEMESPVIMSD